MEKVKIFLHNFLYEDGKLSRKNALLLCGILIVIAILLGSFISELFRKEDPVAEGIDGKGRTFVADEVSFNRGSEGLESGSIIIFKRENALNGYLIKRVIATEGQTVNIDGDGVIYIDEEKYETTVPYYQKDVPMPIKVPEGQLFVLGEGDKAVDSRYSYVGFVSIDEVSGIANEK